MIRIITILLALSLISCYVSEDIAPDQTYWKYGLPQSYQLNEAQLTALDIQLTDGNYGNITGLTIHKDDHFIFENYYNGHYREELIPIGRITTTLMILLLDDFVSSGQIASLETPLMDFFPEYIAIFENEPTKKQITLQHLLDHRSGLSWNESNNPDGGDLFLIQSVGDRVAYILSKRQESDPGIRFTFSSANGMLLSAIYSKLLNGESLESYIDRRLLTPIEIENYSWDYTENGLLNGINGLTISQFDMIKLGYLLFQDGRWINKERVIDRDWVIEMASAQNIPAFFSVTYGFGIWQLGEDLQNSYRIPSDFYFLSGESGQAIYMVPSKGMVVTIGANYASGSPLNNSFQLFRRIYESIEEPATPN